MQGVTSEVQSRTERDWLDIILASDGETAAQREFVLAHRLDNFLYIVSAPLGISYQVSRLPFAALIDAQGVLRARGIVNSREHLAGATHITTQRARRPRVFSAGCRDGSTASGSPRR
jgi:methylamine dehydrogenase accessory protein MauD